MIKIHHAYKSALTIVCAFIISLATYAGPYFGTEFKFKQPDASLVAVKVWGDEFYQRVESLDGYTLVRDTTGWITYAVLSADGNALVSTGIRYNGAAANLTGIPKGIDIHASAANKIRAANRARLLPALPSTANQRNASSLQTPTNGDVRGLTILIDFSDEPATIGRDSIEHFFNETGYTDFGNNGSIHDYFWDVSNHHLNYTNAVLGYYRAIHPKTYYEDTINSHVGDLIQEALLWADAQGFDFSTLSVDETYIRAINLMYAGYPTMGWAKGLWPHAGGHYSFSADGVNSGSYQMTNIGENLTIATTCHENGHMLMHWPDLYDYDYNSAGIGRYCLMAFKGAETNPVPPNAYLRIDAGWENYTDLTDTTGTFTTQSNANQSYIITNPSKSDELFVIESRTIAGRNASLPDDGLMIWHVDISGNNSANEMTPTSHFYLSLEQADGLFDLEHYNNQGAPGDLYKAGSKTVFNDNTLPDARWWNGTASGIQLHSVSAVGETMEFTLGGIVIPDQCTYGAPLTSALPSIPYKQYAHSHILGDGGPNLSSVSMLAINWDQQSNGLWNFSLNLYNTAPYYIDLKTKSTNTFGSAAPSLTLTNTGIPGLDGEYYATLHNGNFVLVNTNSNFTIYFSNDATPPACSYAAQARIGNNVTDVSVETNLAPNPASDFVQITSDLDLQSATVSIVNEQGQRISVPYTTKAHSIDINISDLAKGFYLMTVAQDNNIAVKKLVVTE